jgi:hypothetical protein
MFPAGPLFASEEKATVVVRDTVRDYETLEKRLAEADPISAALARPLCLNSLASGGENAVTARAVTAQANNTLFMV